MEVTTYIRLVPVCVPLHSFYPIPLGAFAVCDDPLGIGVAHENRKFGLVKYLADTCDGRYMSIVCPSMCGLRGDTPLFVSTHVEGSAMLPFPLKV